MNCRCGCRNRRCLDPLLPSNVASSLKYSSTVETSPQPRHLSSTVPDSKDGSCKDLGIDRTLSSESRHGVTEGAEKTSSAGGIVSTVSSKGANDLSTPPSCRRRSLKFSDVATWSRFHQQRATALTSQLEKVFLASVSCIYSNIFH